MARPTTPLEPLDAFGMLLPYRPYVTLFPWRFRPTVTIIASYRSDFKKTVQNSYQSSRRASILFFGSAVLVAACRTAVRQVHDSSLAIEAREGTVQSDLRNSTFLSGTTALVRCFPSARYTKCGTASVSF